MIENIKKIKNNKKNDKKNSPKRQKDCISVGQSKFICCFALKTIQPLN